MEPKTTRPREERFSRETTSAILSIPNLVEIQLKSYQWFCETGLLELFRSFSPMEDFTGNTKLELVDYFFDQPKYSVEECRDRDMTYEAPIRARVRLTTAGGEMPEQEVYLGDLPLMTERGTFVVNGAERVVVSQLARSPGVYFKDTIDFSGQVLYFSTIIPNEGAWMEIDTDANGVVWVRIAQNRKFALTTLLRALNEFPEACPITYEWIPVEKAADRRLADRVMNTDTGEVFEAGELITEDRLEDLKAMVSEGKVRVERDPTECHTTPQIIDLFSKRKTVLEPTRENVTGLRAAEDVVDPKSGKVIVHAYGRIERSQAQAIERLRLPELEILEVSPYIEATLEQDPATDKDDAQREALLDIYRKIRPGDPATVESARNLLHGLFFDVRRYDMARVGRYKLNRKLGLGISLDVRHVTVEDLLGVVRYFIALSQSGNEEWMARLDASSLPDYTKHTLKRASVDDIDHLENKRVRSIGELLQSQLRMGFMRMEKVAKERMTQLDADNLLPQMVLSVKPISASIKSFFGSSQLSQFMGQTNPLDELTHKRRLSALGPGGLSRQSAKLEVRDVHSSHYGRICPIETPEGPNIGLIGSMAVFAQINEFGFIETPYRKVADGVASDETVFITADGEDEHYIAPANTPLDPETGRILSDRVVVRHDNTYPQVAATDVQYMDISPMQLVSPATALIPFLENDDANRALMGSNMQRQSVPLVVTEAPVVKTGLERKVAVDSGAVVTATREGVVEKVTAEEIAIRGEDGNVDTYRLMNMARSNQATCITQKPLARKGQRVRAGHPIADGPCTDRGELALGRNVLAAFMPWRGYNYEDAILVSQRLVKDDVFTSIHIERYETEARDTKLGAEEITRDIPNVAEDSLKDLDENGIIRVGADVRPEDILVGKVAPKGQGELTAEERLIIAIFGKKAEETRDVSLRVPHGEKGKIVDVKVFSRYKFRCTRCQTVFNFSKKPERMLCERCDGELARMPSDELPAGVNQLVRVYIAQKRKIMEGDKMAGRHGNKGVISKIMAEEDMPFMPDGRPVDVVLNPLGVPSRMNIGQILETHLGIAARYLDCSYVAPIFQGFRESEILSELDQVATRLYKKYFCEYLASELRIHLPSVLQRNPDSILDELSLEDLKRELRRHFLAMEPGAFDEVGRYLGIPLDEANSARSDAHPREALKRRLPLAASVGSIGAGHALTEAQARKLVEEGRDSVPVWMLAKTEENIDELLRRLDGYIEARAGLNPRTGKCVLRDGLTGEPFDQPVTVGYIYILKLAHLVDDKIHARSTGPYSLVTQQPLGGKAQFGGQRFGEMEVWALEAYGAAYTLQEILTIKSDDVLGRVRTYESIIKGDSILEPGVPESFKILINELQSLGLRVVVEDEQNREINLRATEDDMGEDGSDAAKRARKRRASLELRED
ncbi:MAG: DNA-directed RNA polymerase subunit beta [Armatimonadetes bacterium]|nr:DNA-directed RNA polymerase subunit beta [Armatimonadota bacterium]